MKYSKTIIFIILILYFLSNLAGALEISKSTQKGISLRDKNISWMSFEHIITPLPDKARFELSWDFHNPNKSIPWRIDYNQRGTLISEIDVYINGSKENFSEFFQTETYGDNFKITQIKDIIVNESSNLKLDYYIKPTPDLLVYNNDKDTWNISYTTSFFMNQNVLFNSYIFRVPISNAHNTKLEFQNSVIKFPDNNLSGAVVSEIFVTDKYVEVNYVFWNDALVNQIITNDDLKFPNRLKAGNYTYSFQNIFSIGSDSVRIDWILQAVVVAILLTITFYLGTLWQRKRISVERINPPK